MTGIDQAGTPAEEASIDDQAIDDHTVMVDRGPEWADHTVMVDRSPEPVDHTVMVDRRASAEPVEDGTVVVDRRASVGEVMADPELVVRPRRRRDRRAAAPAAAPAAGPSSDPVGERPTSEPPTITPPPGGSTPSPAPVPTTRDVLRPAPPVSALPPLPAEAVVLRGEATALPSVARTSRRVARVGAGLWLVLTAGCAVGVVLVVLTLLGR